MLKISRSVIKGQNRGKKIGFPTLNFLLKKNDKIKRGIWLVKLKIKQKKQNKEYFGIANAGRAKTFNEKKERVEVHLLFSKPQRIKKAEIYFLKYLRKTKKFKKTADLKKQIKKDIKRALKFKTKCGYFFSAGDVPVA